MRAIFATAAAILASFLLWAPVSAHPLGTSTNVYLRVLIEPGTVHVRYVLDVSEQIAVHERQFADVNGDGTVDPGESTRYLDGLWVYLRPKISLTIGGQQETLERSSQELTFPPGQGGLPLVRAVYDLNAPFSASSGEVEGAISETTFDGLPGWHEIVVQGSAGVSIVASSVPAQDLTNELRSYPQDRLNDPLVVRSATFTFTAPVAASTASSAPSPSATVGPPASAGTVASPAPGSTEPADDGRPRDPLVGLVGGNLDVVAALTALLVAFGLGAFHALSPGHGKTVVAAYLLGSQASMRNAIWLGLTVAITHTLGVFVLGVATYFATEWILPTRIVGWLSIATGVLVAALGVILIWRAWKSRGHWLGANGADHGHEHGPAGRHTHAKPKAGAASSHHGAAHAAPTAPPPAPGLFPDLRGRDLAALGIVGGLVPSGSALLLLLSAVALGRIAFGIVLIVAFGVGMAAVLAGITMSAVMLRGARVTSWSGWRQPWIERLLPVVPLLSGVIVVGVGAMIAIQAVSGLR